MELGLAGEAVLVTGKTKGIGAARFLAMPVPEIRRFSS